ncbi:hypothetical protein JAAARDRAFT_196645 [Jaapia argillacea MUCL 33604]|uniref:Protein kinase domain-containing protein n=1 Tax=Jaapia argillacea MUCL 33604 TaxID=933084 RepID=A0A067PK99_9AGAM|nr:hypothetical protein JAAARDRAFT_196645 [Jaapia argillacea MUCL 33604]
MIRQLSDSMTPAGSRTRTERRPSAFVIGPDEVDINYKDLLGEGGFGSVYRGRWGGHDVAVKVLQKGIPAELLRREVDVWKSIRHPNIAEFFGYNSSSAPLFLVSALKQRGNALSFVLRHPDADRPKLLHEAALGLQYLHRHSIVHGDLKGLNILVDKHGVACLSDFGLSLVRMHSTSNATNAGGQGTLQWMAPEQMSGSGVNKRSDVYSFGMTIYEIFVGHAPFGLLPNNTVFAYVRNEGGRPIRPSQSEITHRGLDDAMWSLVEECWSQEPRTRPPAADLVHRLEVLAVSYAGEQEISQRTLHPPEKSHNDSDDISASLGSIQLQPTIESQSDGPRPAHESIPANQGLPISTPVSDDEGETSRQITTIHYDQSSRLATTINSPPQAPQYRARTPQVIVAGGIASDAEGETSRQITTIHYGESSRPVTATNSVNPSPTQGAAESGRQSTMNAIARPHVTRLRSLLLQIGRLDNEFKRTPKLVDLEEQIRLRREITTLLSEPTERAWSLTGLAYYLSLRFDHYKKVEDLDEAIECDREALKLEMDPVDSRATTLLNVAAHLNDRFIHAGRIEDSDESLMHVRQALGLFPGIRKERGLKVLIAVLAARYKQLGRPGDLEELEVLWAEEAEPEQEPDGAGV